MLDYFLTVLAIALLVALQWAALFWLMEKVIKSEISAAIGLGHS